MADNALSLICWGLLEETSIRILICWCFVSARSNAVIHIFFGHFRTFFFLQFLGKMTRCAVCFKKAGKGMINMLHVYSTTLGCIWSITLPCCLLFVCSTTPCHVLSLTYWRKLVVQCRALIGFDNEHLYLISLVTQSHFQAVQNCFRLYSLGHCSFCSFAKGWQLCIHAYKHSHYHTYTHTVMHSCLLCFVNRTHRWRD